MKKKGIVFDWWIYGIMIFIIATSIIVIYYINSKLNDAFQDSDNIPTQSKDMMADYQAAFRSTWENFFILLVIGLFIAVIIIAYVLRSHPVFAGIAILLLISGGVLATHLSNAYHNVATTDTMVSYASDFTIISYMMEHLPHIFILLGLVFIVVLYAKSRAGSPV